MPAPILPSCIPELELYEPAFDHRHNLKTPRSAYEKKALEKIGKRSQGMPSCKMM